MEGKTMAGFGVGLLAGAVIGGVMALLYAPKSGKETRKLIKDTTIEVVDAVKEEASEVVGTIGEFAGAVRSEAGEVIDKVGEAASGAGRKGRAAVKALKS